MAAPESIKAAVIKEIAAANKDLPVYNLRTMEQMVSHSLGPRRFQAMLLSAFATVALALTAIGIYGVVACTVGQRTREIAVRIALGAQTRDVFKLTIGDGMRPVMIGVLMGILGGLGTARILASQLFGVAASDPKTVVGISLFLALAALLACWLPARRAATVDPMEALRCE